MAKNLNRWQKESGEFLDALVGSTEPYRGHKETTAEAEQLSEQDIEKEKLLKLRQISGGGRPKHDAPPLDRLIVYNIKIKESDLNALRQLSKDQTLTIRELLSEAVHDLLVKYKEK